MTRTLILTLSAALTLAACSGTMQGRVRGTGAPVQFAYEEGLDSDKMTAVIGAESFQGKAVAADASATTGTIYGPGWDFATVTGYSSSGKARALLFGSKGSSLRCELSYADPLMGTSSGGVGVCRHSDGRVIDVMW